MSYALSNVSWIYGIMKFYSVSFNLIWETYVFYEWWDI